LLFSIFVVILHEIPGESFHAPFLHNASKKIPLCLNLHPLPRLKKSIFKTAVFSTILLTGLSTKNPVSAQCNVDNSIYASPGGTGVGTKSSPTNIVTALVRCAGDTSLHKIKLSTGTHIIKQTLEITSGIQIDGGFDIRNGEWIKSNSAVTTLSITPRSEFPEIDYYGTKIQLGQYVGIRMNKVEKVTLKDFKLEVWKAEYPEHTNKGSGMTVYGIVAIASKNIILTKLDITTDNGGDGVYGDRGQDGGNADLHIPGGRTINKSTTNYNDPVLDINEGTNSYRAGGKGGRGGVLQEYVICHGTSCIFGPCMPGPAPLGQTGGSSGGVNGGIGAQCGDPCAIDCYYEYYTKQIIVDKLSDLVDLPMRGMADPKPKNALDASNGTGVYSSTNYVDQTVRPPADYDIYFIPTHGAKGGDGSGGAGGGGGGAGGIRTLALPPAIPGSNDPYSTAVKGVNTVTLILAVSGVKICQAEVLNKSTEGGNGGGGGEGGEGGDGGGGGGGSFGVFCRSGTTVTESDCVYHIGTGGLGGPGGFGGKGGDGGYGRYGALMMDGGFSYTGSKGGNGGHGGNGGRGQGGSNGVSIAKFLGNPSATPFFLSDVQNACSNSVIPTYNSGGSLYNTSSGSVDGLKIVEGSYFRNKYVEVYGEALGALPINFLPTGKLSMSAPVTITKLRSLPKFSAPTVVCTGDSAHFSADSVAFAYSWKVYDRSHNDSLVKTSNNKDFYFKPYAASSFYRVTYQAYDQCCGYSIPQSVNFSVSKIAAPVIERLSQAPFCFGTDSLRIDWKNYNTYTLDKPFTFTWSNPADTGKIIWAKKPGNYFLTATNKWGCSAKSNVVTNDLVLALPTEIPVLSDQSGICYQNPVSLQPQYTAGMLYNFYQDPVSKKFPVAENVRNYFFYPQMYKDTFTYYVRSVNTYYFGKNNFEVHCQSNTYKKVSIFREKVKPVVTISDIYLKADANRCGIFYYYAPPKATDNCGLMLDPVFIHTAKYHYYPIGLSIDTVKYQDLSGNVLIQPIRIHVEDNTAPKVTSYPGISNNTVNTDPGKCTVYYPFQLGKASDNCTTLPVPKGPFPQTIKGVGQSFSSLYISNQYKKDSIFNVGKTTFYHTWADSSGNNTAYSFDLTVKDNEAPVVQCPDSITYYVTKDSKTAITVYSALGVKDNCEYSKPSKFISGFGQYGTHPIGNTTEVWQAEDAAGNIGTCSFKLMVKDTIKPTIDCGAAVYVNAGAGSDSVIANFATPLALDNSGNVTVSTLSKASGSYFKIGSTNVVYTARDSSGNKRTCTKIVLVSDADAPAIVCPASITALNTPGVCGRKVNFTMTAAKDNDTHYYWPVKTLGLDSGSVFPIGITNQVYRTTDAANNRSYCSFTVTIKDTIAPVFTNCPHDTIIQVTPAVCGAQIMLATPHATDNACKAPVVGFYSGAIGYFPVGVTKQVYVAHDEYFNTATCSYSVTVVDNNTITLACPPDVEVSNDPGLCGAYVRFNPAKSTPVYNSCGVLTLTTPFSDGKYFVPGTHDVTFKYTAGAKSATCVFHVKVNDTEHPKLSKPNNIVVHIDKNTCGKTVAFTNPVATDNCTNGSTFHIQGLNSGAMFPIGTTLERFNTYDNLSSDSAIFTITVLDTIKPVFAAHADITEHTSEVCGKVINFNPPVATDNSSCIVTKLVSGLNTGERFPVGITKQIFVVTDGAGNTDSSRFNITVISDTPSVFVSCPPSQVVPSDNNNGLTAIVWYDIPGHSLCTGVTTLLTKGKGSGATFPAGKTREEYLLKDASGHTSTCAFDVIVTENVAPYVMCDNQLTYELNPLSCGAVVSLKTPQVDDYGGSGLSFMTKSAVINGATVDLTKDTSHFFPAGFYTIEWVAYDNSSNKGVCYTQLEVKQKSTPANPIKSFHVCEGESVAVNPAMGGGPYTYSWQYYNPYTFNMTVVSTDSIFKIASVTKADDKQYQLVISSKCLPFGFYNKEFKLSVDSAPVVSLSGLKAQYCMYDSSAIPLSFSPARGVLSGAGISGNNFYPNKAGVGTHTINYTYYDSTLSCPATASITVKVYAIPVATAFLDSAYCINMPIVKLDATNSLYSGKGISGATFSPATATAGTYPVTRTVTVNGCVNVLTQKVRVNGNVPNATIVTKGPFCSNEYFKKLVSVTPGGTWGGGAALFTDSNKIAFFNVRNVVGSQSHITYKVTKDVCSAKDSVMIQVKSASDSLPFTLPKFCYNDAPVLLDTTNHKNYFGHGIKGNYFSPSAIDTSTASMYAVSTINKFGCMDTVWRMLVVAKPEIVNPFQTICHKGDSLLLKLDPAFKSVKWFDNTTSYNKWVSDSGSYKVTLNDKYGCSLMDTVHVKYGSTHAPFITGSHKLFKCIYDSVVLKTDTTFLSYTWSTGQHGRTIYAKYPGTYSVVVMDANNCPQRDTALVENFVPLASKIKVTGPTLEASVSSHYQWFKDGVAIPGATGRTYSAKVQGKYYVVLADPNNCATSSDTITVIITGMEIAQAGNEFSIYPNPGSGKFVLSMKNIPDADVEVELTNVIGEHIQTLHIGRGAVNLTYTINLEDRATGVYSAHIKYAQYSHVMKIVKME
jgi:hypothetical protein